MHRYNCRGKSVFETLFEKEHEAIKKWAKAKGVDPEHVFTANDWDIPKYGQCRTENISKLRCKLPLSIVVKRQINTATFEEAIIDEL